MDCKWVVNKLCMGCALIAKRLLKGYIWVVAKKIYDVFSESLWKFKFV